MAQDDLIQRFELPYPNWHDEEGRIYKDILIDNFNAIENKINELLSINIDSITKPDINSVEYPDVDLATGDDDSILNLKSFLNIVNLINFPLVVITNGNNKVTKVEYWGEDYKYHTVINTTVVATEDKPFIYLNTEDSTIISSSSVSSPEHCVLLAMLVDNKLITNNAKIAGNVDFIRILSNQAKKFTALSGNGNPGIPGDGGGARKGRVQLPNTNQTVFMWNGEQNSRNSYSGNISYFGLDGGNK